MGTSPQAVATVVVDGVSGERDGLGLDIFTPPAFQEELKLALFAYISLPCSVKSTAFPAMPFCPAWWILLPDTSDPVARLIKTSLVWERNSRRPSWSSRRSRN